MASRNHEKQNMTLSLSRDLLNKPNLIANEEAYERAERQALALLEKGFHLGGAIGASRDEIASQIGRGPHECVDLCLRY